MESNSQTCDVDYVKMVDGDGGASLIAEVFIVRV